MKKKELISKIDAWLRERREEYIKDVISAVNIPSISGKSEGIYPYGKDCAKMLDFMQEVMERYTLPYQNHEYHCASSLIKGKKGNKEIGLFCHTDVVPAVGEWEFDPFSAFEKDGHIYGRGSNDNKGSVFSCIYALRFLQENDYVLNSSVRLFLGANEEAGMNDCKYYLHKYKAPDYSIVADSWFPLSASEKGRYVFSAKTNKVKGNLLRFFTENDSTSVPSECFAVLSGVAVQDLDENVKNTEGIKLIDTVDGMEVIASGVGNHPAFPEGTVNAVKRCADFLLKNQLLIGEVKESIKNIRDSILDYYGEAFSLDFRDEFAGRTTHVLTKVLLSSGYLNSEYIFCYPAVPTLNKEQVYKKIIKHFTEMDMNCECVKEWNPHYVDANHEIAHILCENSSLVYGKKLEPFAMAGGTYTWILPNSFAAGPNVRHITQSLYKIPGHGFPHQPDECMNIDVWLNGIKIYILSLIEIDEWLSGPNGIIQ